LFIKFKVIDFIKQIIIVKVVKVVIKTSQDYSLKVNFVIDSLKVNFAIIKQIIIVKALKVFI